MTFIPKKAYSLTHVVATDVADDATFTVSYPTSPSTLVQADFNAGQYKEGSAQFIVNGSTKWLEADPGIEVTTFGASSITLTNRTGATLAAGASIVISFELWATQPVILTVPVFAMSGIIDGDLVTALRPGLDGYITYWEWVQGVPVTTGSKLSTLNMEIGSTNLTGGTISLTSAACTPLGKVIAGTRITANNRITKASNISIEGSSTTAFVEGSGFIRIHVQPDVL